MKHLLKATSFRKTALMAVGAATLAACTTVTLEGGEKPIEVNLNVKIEHEIRVKVDKELDDLFAEKGDLF